MIAGQTLRARDGYQVALFPLEYMYISQGEMMPSGWSHYNTYNMDFLGYGLDIISGILTRIYNCPMYAPCDLKVISLWDYSGSHTVTFESLEKVHLADGSIDYLTIGFTHADTPPYHTLGDIVRQGELIYYTGTYGNVTGDHVHMTAGKGRFVEYTQREGGHYDLSNRTHLYNALYVNNTFLIEDDDYPWIIYEDIIPTRNPPKVHFPWVLYAKKLRNKNIA